jgi:septal ring factor EnvC (AmiA/AmiB activator)
MRRLALLLGIALAIPALSAAQDTRQIDRELERLRSELVDLGSKERSREGEAIRQRAALMELNAREAAIRARIDANRGSLAKLLGALQTYQRRPPPPLLVNPRSARDAVRAAILIKAVTPELQARGKVFAAQAEAIAKVRRSAAAASETLFQAESDIADHRADIDRLLTQKQALEDRLPSTDDPQARALAARAGSVGELVGGLSGRSGAPAAAPDRLAPPVQGLLIRRFGDRGGGSQRTEGWTWAAAPAAPVLSPAPARVDYAGPLKGWGPVVILNVGGGRRLVLAGLETVAVGIGRAVAAGEPLGRLGPGNKEGAKDRPPELYMEVREGSQAVDPGRWSATAALKSPTPAGNTGLRLR